MNHQQLHPGWQRYRLPEQRRPPVINDPSLPLISVVTPSFNQGHFIRETIDSVLSQDYPNLEYWVVDGGSSDETLDILREYERDPRFHWLTERDSGQADAVNKGWRRCRGELVGWLNSDDVYYPSALRRLAEPLLASTELEVVYADVMRVRHDGTPIERLYGQPFDLAALLRGNYVNQPAVLQRRSVIEVLGPLDNGLRYGLDYEWYLRAARACSMRYLPLLAATYRMHEVSKTTTGGSVFTAELAEVADRCFDAPDMPPELHKRRRAINADWWLQIGMEQLQEHNGVGARRSLMRALRADPLRARLVFFALQALDSRLNTSLYARAVEWRQTRKKLRFESRLVL